MRALSAAELLNVWERGAAQPPAQRALTLLAAACADTPIEEISRWSIGRRDARLMELRERTFGSQLQSVTTCPACKEPLEFTMQMQDLSRSLPENAMEPLSVKLADYEVRFRLPNSVDLASLNPALAAASNRQQLMHHCVLEACCAGTSIGTDELPSELQAAIADRMGEADPQADVRFVLECARCSHSWQASFDIASFFWSEIQAWGSRLLREVHLLASEYGWREADILALGPLRRQTYLEMIGP